MFFFHLFSLWGFLIVKIMLAVNPPHKTKSCSFDIFNLMFDTQRNKYISPKICVWKDFNLFVINCNHKCSSFIWILCHRWQKNFISNMLWMILKINMLIKIALIIFMSSPFGWATIKFFVVRLRYFKVNFLAFSPFFVNFPANKVIVLFYTYSWCFPIQGCIDKIFELKI